MESALAIDFGNSNTKVAWREPDGSVHLLLFDGVPYLPSLFYLPQGTDEILLGEDARAAYEDDPLGAVTELKRKIQLGASIRTTEDRKVDPQELLAHLFRTIKRQALKQIDAFGDLSPEQVWLTVPGKDSERLELVLKQAAKNVGWQDMAETTYEPVAAARYWLYGAGCTEEVNETVVVLDCGGGTTDWTCLERAGDRIHPSEEFRPGGVSVGGADVDQALLDWVHERHPEIRATRPEPRLRDQLRVWKEAMLGGEEPAPIRYKGRPLDLDEAVLADAYRRALLDKVAPPFERFLQPIKERHPDVPVLLVGGGATSLVEQAARTIHPLLRRSQDSVGTVIRGALAPADLLWTTAPEARLPPIQNLHGWNAARLQNLQKVTAKALGTQVFFRHTLKTGGEGPVMAVIPAGTFLMGAEWDTRDEHGIDAPCYPVTIDRPYAIARRAVTYFDYKLFCNHVAREDPYANYKISQPLSLCIEVVTSWYDAQDYCTWLSWQTGKKYRLPSDTEWELAYRPQAAAPPNLDWLLSRDGSLFNPNPWGLLTHNATLEWCGNSCHDDYEPTPGDDVTIDRSVDFRVACSSDCNADRTTTAFWRTRLRADGSDSGASLRLVHDILL